MTAPTASSQTVQNGETIGYVYNIPGRTRQITYPGGRVITEHTDARARMDHIDDALPAVDRAVQSTIPETG